MGVGENVESRDCEGWGNRSILGCGGWGKRRIRGVLENIENSKGIKSNHISDQVVVSNRR